MKYSREPQNRNKSSLACLSGARIHFKNTYETAQAIKHMELSKAKQYLEDVIEHKRCIPFRKFTGSIGRTAQAKAFKVTQGRWPVKSCKALLNLLNNAESNAVLKDLVVKDLHVEHIMVNRGERRYRRTFRAHGRINPYMSVTSHVQVILAEKSKDVAKAEAGDKKIVKLTKRQMARKRLSIGGGI